MDTKQNSVLVTGVSIAKYSTITKTPFKKKTLHLELSFSVHDCHGSDPGSSGQQDKGTVAESMYVD